MRKTLGALAALLWSFGAATATAQTFPNRTVTIVVTSAAGAATDALTRAVAQRLTQKWGQTVVVENRGGAGHTLAAVQVMKADPDGHTLLSSETGFASIQPHLQAKGKLPFDVDTDFVPVAGFASIPIGLLVHPSVASSIPELIKVAKEKAGGVTYGTAGLGTVLHTGALLLGSLAGTSFTAVHYRGAAPALNDLIAGHINMVTMGPSVAFAAVRAGQIKLLGFGSQKRMPQFPDVPTIGEAVPGYEASVSFGLFALSKTPRELLVKINADVQEVINEPEFHKRFIEPMVVQPIPGSMEAFAAYLKKDSDKWAKVIRDANLKID
jgi:tripartite-type tricarboxylate transporter receptor subunit TctC